MNNITKYSLCKGLILAVITFFYAGFSSVWAANQSYVTVPGNSFTGKVTIQAARFVTRAVVLPFPHLRVSITRKIGNEVSFTVTPTSQVIPGITYTVTLKHPGRDQSFKVLVAHKGTMTNARIEVPPGEKNRLLLQAVVLEIG